MLRVKNSFKIIILSLVIFFCQQVLASMDSDNYQIWLDTIDAGGGLTNSSSYKIDSNLGDFNASSSQSYNFKQIIAFSGIKDKPTVGFNVQTVTLNFGELTPNSTAYGSHTLSAYTNSREGYIIKVYGQPLHSTDHILTAIGDTPSYSQVGIEQFGLNLVSNSVPLVGADPSGGIGQAANNYNIANKYAYTEGSTIAYAESYSYQTDFTVSVIVNISEKTPAGIYATTLTYEFIPVF